MPLRVGVIGYPVEHSLSPAFQQPALDALGIDATYALWSTPPDELPDRIAGLRAKDVLGANVTVPHKQAVVPLLDELEPTARRAEAVNTIIPRDGRLVGDNTDVFGIDQSLREAGIPSGEFEAVVLGAGGAARAVMLALEGLGVRTIAVVNRSQERALALISAFPDLNISVHSRDDPVLEQRLGSASLLVNATALGWKPDEMPMRESALDLLRQRSLVFDLTYRDTALLVAASRRGLRTLDGLPMLVYQGARAFSLWTGRDAPIDIMMQAAREARSARS
jgi:shikimate dehydrogenase